MDDSGSWSETSSPEASLPPSGKKAKGKAPLPPGEVRYAESLPSFDSTDSAHFTMEQKENFIDRDIELKVVLPGERTALATVNGSKPMMDLLIHLCGQYRLNPSAYTIEMIAPDRSVIKFKPNTPVGMLEVEKVVLKSKIPDDKNKKPCPTMPEQTVRVVINYKKTQKTVMRVSPLVPLQDLIPSICNKCEFDPLYTVLLKDYQSQRPLDVTKSLSDLGLRELYATDTSRATSPIDLKPPPLQESCQNLDIKQNDEKGFFNFFRRSKKKRDQTSSAPATPLLGKPRPTHIVRANTVSKSYDSNTLPSEVPKKRRAPLPPMHTSQSDSHNISRGQMRSSSCVVKTVDVNDTEKVLSGIDRSRTGSLQLSGSTSFNSTLRTTKRKAPPPPSPPPKSLQECNDENRNEIAPVAEEFVHAEKVIEKEIRNLTTTTATVDVISEHNLEEIEEKEEYGSNHKGDDVDTKTIDVPSSINDGDSHAEKQNFLLSHTEDSIRRSEDEIMTDAESSHSKTEDTVIEANTLEHVNNDLREVGTSNQTLVSNRSFETKEVQVEEQPLTPPRDQHHESKQPYFQDGTNAQTETANTLVQTGTQKGKTQDFAVQTNFDSDVDVDNEKELAHSPASSGAENVASRFNGQPVQQPSFTNRHVGLSGSEQNKREYFDSSNRSQSFTEDVHTQTVIVKGSVIESPVTSPSKTFQLHKPNIEPKPKPFNEVTRDYLPKIGMTTYKIVPQRSFEIERYVETENPPYAQNPESLVLSNQEINHTEKETKSLSPLGSPRDYNELPSILSNGNHSSQHGTTVTPSSPVTNSSTEDSRKHLLALTKSLSSAPALKTEKMNIPDSKPKPNNASSVKAPSSFYLQMQRRASSMYVTSAIAKAKSSTTTCDNAPKLKDPVKDNAQVSIKNLPSRMDALHLDGEKLPEEKSTFVVRSAEAKRGNLETISDGPSELEKNSGTCHTIFETHPQHSEIKNKVGLGNVAKEYPAHVSYGNRNGDNVEPAAKQNLESVQIKPLNPTTTAHKSSDVLHNEHSSGEVLTTSSGQAVRSPSSPTGQSVPLSLQKLRTFATPRPFSSTHPTSFATAVTSAVKRSQSFSSSTSPAKHPLRADTISDCSSVNSNSETKNESSQASIIPQDRSETEILTPELKYRVHSPPPILAKKTAVSFQTSDPEQVRQSLMAAIRSGEAAANLKRITVRSNTISINGRSRLSHPVFSETQHEA
ncbi:cordon-bleu protein-like 1 [Spea bombifrons]|uniref:cordon-bleu protein-like 1 n=1 Tax=Spea bombifrons TaxID=233779 RepID=UPI00234BDE66|nr:cordon-bleu protein-like 1 [Spea bombifrons]